MLFSANEKRVRWLTHAIAVSFFIGIITAHFLWITDRLYPLYPFFSVFLHLPIWIDYVLTPALLVSLLLVVISKKPLQYIVAVLILATFLFLEDRSRLFPSFYEYFLLLLVLSFYFFQTNARDSEKTSGVAETILNMCRLAIIFIYIWTGAQKINPFFQDQIAWVMTPILGIVPNASGWLIRWATLIAPFVEIEIGIALLFKKTRKWAVIEALFMHGMLFFLIGPFFRTDWNAGAWVWNLASGFIVFILFFQTSGVAGPRAREIFFLKNQKKHFFDKVGWVIVLVFFGILPAFNFANLWYSGLSFNVFGGNITQARIYTNGSTAERLPPEIKKYLNMLGTDKDSYILNTGAWSEDELRAEPYHEAGAYKNIARFLCGYATKPSDIEITIYEKLTLFHLSSEKRPQERYTCLNFEQKVE